MFERWSSNSRTMLVELEEVSAGDEFRMGKTADDMFEGVENELPHVARSNNQVIDAVMWCQKLTPQQPERSQNGIQIDQRGAKRRSGSQVGFRSLFLFSLETCCFRLLAPLG